MNLDQQKIVFPQPVGDKSSCSHGQALFILKPWFSGFDRNADLAVCMLPKNSWPFVEQMWRLCESSLSG